MAVISPQRRVKWVLRERIKKHCQERYYLQCGKARHRIKEYPYLPPQSLRYLFTGAGPLGPRRHMGYVNNSKVGKKEAKTDILKVKKKKVNIINSDMDLELELGKE